MSARSTMVGAAVAGIYHGRLTRALALVAAHAGPPAFPILTYHRVNDEGDPFFPALPTPVFERHMAHVARHYRVLTVEALVEFTATLPARLKMRGLKMRHVFGKAFGALLPAAILAKRKQGFGVPTALWLRTHPRFRELARDLLLSPGLRERGQLRAQGIARLLDLHDGEASPYYGDLLWRVLMLELWQRRHVDGEVAA